MNHPFANRMPSYEEGYTAFFNGHLTNPYRTTRYRGDNNKYWRRRNDHQFLNEREWEAGFNQAYADNLLTIGTSVAA